MRNKGAEQRGLAMAYEDGASSRSISLMLMKLPELLIPLQDASWAARTNMPASTARRLEPIWLGRIWPTQRYG